MEDAYWLAKKRGRQRAAVVVFCHSSATCAS
jgi:hypothetical protein